jgi:hypothetical protein
LGAPASARAAEEVIAHGKKAVLNAQSKLFWPSNPSFIVRPP